MRQLQRLKHWSLIYLVYSLELNVQGIRSSARTIREHAKQSTPEKWISSWTTGITRVTKMEAYKQQSASNNSHRGGVQHACAEGKMVNPRRSPSTVTRTCSIVSTMKCAPQFSIFALS